MRLMIRAELPNDYLLATGISHRLSFFIDRAFRAAGITDWARYVVSTEANTRAADTNLLTGESRAAREQLGWHHTVDFDSMAARMVAYDMALLKDPDFLWLDF
jgi:GDPmannose 4,6-dehydratase